MRVEPNSPRRVTLQALATLPDEPEFTLAELLACGLDDLARLERRLERALTDLRGTKTLLREFQYLAEGGTLGSPPKSRPKEPDEPHDWHTGTSRPQLSGTRRRGLQVQADLPGERLECSGETAHLQDVPHPRGGKDVAQRCARRAPQGHDAGTDRDRPARDGGCLAHWRS
jgi:hypothetical protein